MARRKEEREKRKQQEEIVVYTSDEESTGAWIKKETRSEKSEETGRKKAQ